MTPPYENKVLANDAFASPTPTAERSYSMVSHLRVPLLWTDYVTEEPQGKSDAGKEAN